MKKVAFFLLLIPFLFSCTNKLFIPGPEFEKRVLPYIEDAKTGTEEVLLKLGEPSWTFENGRIMTYRIAIDKKGNVTPVSLCLSKNEQFLSYNYYSPPVKHYSLVLIFSENKILEKHSLLLTNP